MNCLFFNGWFFFECYFKDFEIMFEIKLKFKNLLGDVFWWIGKVEIVFVSVYLLVYRFVFF